MQLLLIHSNTRTIAQVRAALGQFDVTITVERTMALALVVAEHERFDLVVIDIEAFGSDSTSLLRAVRVLGETPLLTLGAEPEPYEMALNAPPHDVDIQGLVAAVRSLETAS